MYTALPIMFHLYSAQAKLSFVSLTTRRNNDSQLKHRVKQRIPILRYYNTGWLYSKNSFPFCSGLSPAGNSDPAAAC